ncbi:unnamed protein product [Caenorhabditis angaria]|uniref:DUF7754 domain-containing protein n=1 Tax=Caenorhabditis angaria TaxID=860376 RepID=A0A9P1IBM7_9PELO|nr:unnamed protein product [Caenorhabditis angaria]
MSLSQLSVLSAHTAVSFDDGDLQKLQPTPPISIFLAIDDQNLPNAAESRNVFNFENKLYFEVAEVIEMGVKRVYLNVSTINPAEWNILVQMRIKTGGGNNASGLHVVDKDVFKFDTFSYPLSVEVQTDEVRFIKFEMRVLNFMHLELPKFNEGDEVIEFDNGSTIRVHSNILGLLSQYMATSEKIAAERQAMIKATSTDKSAFLELLYQVYPTRRPIYSSFRALCAAAVGYKCDQLINKLSIHLINYNHRAMTFQQRFQAAIENRLEPAIRELAFRASRDGTWSRMILQGFEPENFCGKDVYTKIVCPAVFLGKNAPADVTTLTETNDYPNFLDKNENDTSKSVIMFRGTPFYINSGLLTAYGSSQFCIGANGEFVARYTTDFQRECSRENLLPGEVLLQLLAYMHPFGAVPNYNMIRACIVFAHDHGWNVLKENLEQEMEPPTTADEYMSQLVFGEKYGLMNLMRVNIQRAESSCKDLAEQLERHGVLRRLSEKTHESIMDRMCSGWGLNPLVNRLATRIPTTFNNRLVNLQRGRAIVIGEGRAIDTLNSIQSDYAFGEINELVVVD